jgi:hypothetical protein
MNEHNAVDIKYGHEETEWEANMHLGTQELVLLTQPPSCFLRLRFSSISWPSIINAQQPKPHTVITQYMVPWLSWESFAAWQRAKQGQHLERAHVKEMKVRGKSIQRENTRQCKIDYSQSEEAPTRADFSIGAIASAAAVSVFESFCTVLIVYMSCWSPCSYFYVSAVRQPALHDHATKFRWSCEVLGS